MTEHHHHRSVVNSKLTGAILFCAALGFVLIAARYESSVRRPGDRSAQTAIVSENRIGIPHGKQDFTVGMNAKNGPVIKGGSVDPFDPDRGGTQTVMLRVTDSQPVTSVTAGVSFDTTSRKFSLKLASGTPMDGIWQGSWPVDDTYDQVYSLSLSAESKRGTSKIDIVLR